MEPLLHNAWSRFLHCSLHHTGYAAYCTFSVNWRFGRIWLSSSCLVKFVAAHWLIIAPPILWSIIGLSREYSLVRSAGDYESRLTLCDWEGTFGSKLETRNTRGMKFLPHTWDDVSCCYRQFQGWSFHWFFAMIIAEAGILITRAHLWKE